MQNDKLYSVTAGLRNRLIVSCQALATEPLYGSHHMAVMALAAEVGGAAAIRANSPEDISAIKKTVNLPVIGLYKKEYRDSEVYITPTLHELSAIVEAGADIVALDATDRIRPYGQKLEAFYAEIKTAYPQLLLMADVSTFEEGVHAMELGFDIVSTTMSGYTSYSNQKKEPDFILVRQLSALNRVPVFAEGRIWTPEHLVKSFEEGAHAVVIGAAITRPKEITQHFVRHLPKSLAQHDTSHVIGVDIGGTKIKIGLVDDKGQILLELCHSTLPKEGGVMGKVITGIHDIIRQAEQRKWRIRGIGVGSAGQIDPASGSVYAATDLIPNYTGTPIREILETEFGCPVSVDNDVNVLALAEKHFGAARSMQHVVCIAVGTGIGGAILTDGKLLRGMFGGAGELGHISVDMNGRICTCGGIGCLEAYASGTAIAEMMNERLKQKNSVPPKSLSLITAKEVFALWQQGNEDASAVMDTMFVAMGTAIAGIIHALNPQAIIIGGGIADIGQPYFSRLFEEIKKRTMPSMLKEVSLIPSYLGNRSAIVGAALLIWDNELLLTRQ